MNLILHQLLFNVPFNIVGTLIIDHIKIIKDRSASGKVLFEL